MKRRWPLATAAILALAGAAIAAEPGEEIRTQLHKLYEACRTLELDTGRFPTGPNDLEGLLPESFWRTIHGSLEFLPPESPQSILCRKTPIGDRTPCLRLDFGDGHWLNVSGNGAIFPSGLYWESEFVDLMPRVYMEPGQLRLDCRALPDRAAPRSDRCGGNQVNLAIRCNAISTTPWFFGPPNETTPPDFAEWVRPGVVEDAGVLFDVRGVIQLDGLVLPPGQGHRNITGYPRRVEGIQVGAAARRVHLLAGVVDRAEPHATVAVLHLHFASGEDQAITLEYGEDVAAADDPNGLPGRLFPKPGESPGLYSLHHVVRDCLHPQEEISSADFVSSQTPSQPYIMAITLEP